MKIILKASVKLLKFSSAVGLHHTENFSQQFPFLKAGICLSAFCLVPFIIDNIIMTARSVDRS